MPDDGIVNGRKLTEAALASPAIRRLIEEVRAGTTDANEAAAYNRTHNRLIRTSTYNRTHNRHNR